MRLALSFQELFTIIARVRAGRQEAPALDVFRRRLVEMLSAAKSDVERRGASKDESHKAVLAVVAAIDEAVLSSTNPGFRDWSRDTLQTSLFGSHIAGDTFFEHLRDLISADPSPRNSELLEVYQICLLLGYRGRYGGRESEARSLITRIEERLQRTQGGRPPLGIDLSPQAAAPVAAAAWPKRLVMAAVGATVLAGAAFLLYSLVLSSKAGDIQARSGLAAGSVAACALCEEA